MSLPVITIRYCDNEPQVILPDELKDKVEINLIDETGEESLILDYGGICVYKAYRDDFGDGYIWSDYWVSTYIRTHIDSEGTFDLRDLPDIPDADLPKYAKLFPEDDDDMADDKQALAYAIDKGYITQEGYTKPS